MNARYGIRTFGACLTAVTAGLIACGGSTESLGTKYVKTVTVGPEGASISVDDPTIGGTSITIPANALKERTVISIGISAASVVDRAPQGSTAIGPVVDFQPSGTVFAVPVTLTIPVTLPSGVPASRVFVEAVEADGSARTIAATYANGRATIQAAGFTDFGGVAAPAGAACRTDVDCPSGDVCMNGECAPYGMACPAGQVACSTGCVDLATNNQHCGACDVACPSGAFCASGRCEEGDGGVDGGACRMDADCPAGEACVGGVCTAERDAESDADADADAGSYEDADADAGSYEDADADAGVCRSDSDCSPGGMCVSGTCMFAGCTICSGACVDLATSNENCGACGAACASGTRCAAGRCQ